MAKTHDQFFSWLRTAADRGRTILDVELDRSPCDHFQSSTVKQFYAAIDCWIQWRVGLVARLRRLLAEPDYLIAFVDERFSSDRFLIFYMRSARDSDRVIEIDLWNRDRFLDTTGFVAMRQIMNFAREEPTWRSVRQNVANDIRAFEEMTLGLRDELVFAGEPRATNLAAAIAGLSTRSYLDSDAIKATVVVAESHRRMGQAKSCAAMLRPAVEQIIKDAYQEGLRRSLIAPPSAPLDLRAQSDALGRAVPGGSPFMEKAFATYAYGTFAVLSNLGSHTGPIDDHLCDQAWHATIAALTLLAERLPR